MPVERRAPGRWRHKERDDSTDDVLPPTGHPLEGYWGVVEERPGIWYLWPGLCFFSFDVVAGKPLDVLPGGGDKQSDCVQFIGDWIHTINASEWKPVADGPEKERLVRQLLDGYL
jgi:hypothetical protein